MFRFFKDIYFTAFTIFFRAASSTWTPGINAGKGVAGVALIESAFLLAIASWIDVLVGTKSLLDIPKWATIVAFFALCFANRYPLVGRGHGITFEREFTNFTKSRKVLLLASCVVIMLTAIAFFIYSASFHRKLPNHS